MFQEGTIRSLYKPVQPAIRPRDGEVTYQEYLPEVPLMPFIHCYWELRTHAALQSPYTYRAVADGCMDVFFELNRPVESWVMGFCKRYTEFDLENEFHYIGIRFLPTMFPQVFRIDAAELSDRFENLDAVVPELSQWIAHRLNTSQAIENIIAVLDQFFIEKLSSAPFSTDGRLLEAVMMILKNGGLVNVEKDLNSGISPRQLRRLFGQYIGDSAKTFSQVVRFQHILNAIDDVDLRENKLYFDAGYYDQAHFIREFKNFYGLTPGQVLVDP